MKDAIKEEINLDRSLLLLFLVLISSLTSFIVLNYLTVTIVVLGMASMSLFLLGAVSVHLFISVKKNIKKLEDFKDDCK